MPRKYWSGGPWRGSCDARNSVKRATQFCLVTSIVWLALPPAPPVAAQSSFQVVVSSANPSSSLESDQVARYFLKKTTQWEHGLKIVAIDQSSNSAVREAFSEQIHGKEVRAIKSYWQKLIFSGRQTPPLEAGSDREVLDFVRRNSGAIGYVRGETALGSGVKAVRIVD